MDYAANNIKIIDWFAGFILKWFLSSVVPNDISKESHCIELIVLTTYSI